MMMGVVGHVLSIAHAYPESALSPPLSSTALFAAGKSHAPEEFLPLLTRDSHCQNHLSLVGGPRASVVHCQVFVDCRVCVEYFQVLSRCFELFRELLSVE